MKTLRKGRRPRKSEFLRTARLAAAAKTTTADEEWEERRRGWQRSVQFHLREQRRAEGLPVLELAR